MTSAEVSDEVKTTVARRSAGRCEICGDATSDLQLHLRRWQGRASFHRRPIAASDLLQLCMIDHNRVETHRTQAHEHGHLLRAGQHPAFEPVIYLGRWTLLDNDGSTYRVLGPNAETVQ
jgi:hypothetical protein